MTGRRPLVLCLMLSLALAGCGGAVESPGADPTTPTLTPADVPQATDLSGSRLLAPGLGTDGVFDADRLARAHRNRLATTSYRLVHNRTVRYANESRAAAEPVQSLDFVHERSVVAPDRDAYTFTKLETSARAWTAAAPYSRVDIWFHESLVRNRLVDAGGTERYWGFDDEPAGGPLVAPSNHQRVAADLAAVETEVVGQKRVGGLAHYRLRGDGLDGNASLPTPPLATDLHNVSLVGTVDERGVVRSYTLTYDATFAVDGSELRVRRVHRLDRVGGASVERPGWLPTANESVSG
jgi:hypothetical protein